TGSAKESKSASLLQRPGTGGGHLLSGLLESGDLDVEMHLLGELRIRPSRRALVRPAISEGEFWSGPAITGDLEPVLAYDLHAQQVGVKHGQLSGRPLHAVVPPHTVRSANHNVADAVRVHRDYESRQAMVTV